MCIIKLYCNEANFLILMETNNFLNITESCQILYNFSTLCHKYDLNVLVSFSDLLCYLRQKVQKRTFTLILNIQKSNCTPHSVFALG